MPVLYIKESRDLDIVFLIVALYQEALVCYEPSEKGTQIMTSTA